MNKIRFGLLFIMMSCLSGNVFTEEIPGRRSGHTAIYDPENKQMILYGGEGTGGGCPDIWIFNIEKKQWKKIKLNKIPPARNGYRAVYDSENKQMIVFGGFGKFEAVSDVWAFDIVNNKWREIKVKGTTPLERHSHSVIYDSTNKQIILFGGEQLRSLKGLSDTWVFNIKENEWKEIKVEEAPPARGEHTAIYDSTNNQMIIYGGYDRKYNRYFDDIWAFDIKNNKWKELVPEETPPERQSHSAIYDSTNKQMIVFGGRRTRGFLSDIWTFDIENKNWKKIELNTSSRGGHTAVYDSINKQMVIFGGWGNRGALSDTWIFNIESKKWELAAGKEEIIKGRSEESAITPEGMAQGLSDTLRTSFFKTEKFKVLERAKMDEVLKEQKLQLIGITTTKGAAEIGKILNVNYIVIGSVAKIGKEYVINIRTVNVESAEIVIADMEKCDIEQDLLDAVQKLVTRITGKSPITEMLGKSIAVLDVEVK